MKELLFKLDSNSIELNPPSEFTIRFSIVFQVMKTFPAFPEPEDSLSWSQIFSTGQNPEPGESSPHPYTLVLQYIF
jgi:hypothetical protein